MSKVKHGLTPRTKELIALIGDYARCRDTITETNWLKSRSVITPSVASEVIVSCTSRMNEIIKILRTK